MSYFRKLAFLSGSPNDVIPNKNPLATLEDEQKDLEVNQLIIQVRLMWNQRVFSKARIKEIEKEMEDVFEKKVQEKKMKLEVTEKELQVILKITFGIFSNEI